jgi:hypothetical protein
MGPKNKPVTQSITDRVSKKRPVLKVHGLKIRIMPIPPRTNPEAILKIMFLDLSVLSQNKS